MTSQANSDALSTLKGLFKPFLGGVKGAKGSDDNAVIQSAYESVTKIAAVMSERARLRGLEEGETGKMKALGARLQETDGERILALTEYRVSADAGANERAQALLKECGEIRQEIDDAHAVAGGIKSRIESLDHDLISLRMQYRRDLGVFLTAIYAGLIGRYNEVAPGVAEIMLQMAAVRRVMSKYSAGSGAGWNGQVLLPGMRAGEGGRIEPMLDGAAAEFDREANERMSGIVAEMNAAGFIYRVD